MDATEAKSELWTQIMFKWKSVEVHAKFEAQMAWKLLEFKYLLP